MSLRHSASLPQGGRAAVARYLEALTSSPDPSATAGSVSEHLETTDGYPVFTASLDDLAQGVLLARARRTAFRYLVLVGTRAVAEAEVSGDTSADVRVVLLHSAEHAEATARAIEVAERLAAVQGADYELAVVEAPSVQFTALWLHRNDADVFVPTATDVSSIATSHAYSEADLSPFLSARAREVQEMQRRFPGPSGA